MNKSRIKIAKPDIVSYFDGLPTQVLRLKDVRRILSEQRGFWRLSTSTTSAQFIDFLEKYSKLKALEFPFPQRSENCYVWGDVPSLSVLLALKKNLHFSHYTAMRIHGLTEQSPQSIYLTDERKDPLKGQREEIGQAEIDQAFRRAPRISNNWVERDNKKIYLLNGAHTGHLGVVTMQINDDDGSELQARVTNLERTLIDITVRPVYAGGIFEVAKAYELSKDRVSVNKLVAMLKKLSFVYPYHQAIGFYLARAGYKSSQLDLIRRMPVEFDFHLTHELSETRYENGWRLFVPKEF